MDAVIARYGRADACPIYVAPAERIGGSWDPVLQNRGTLTVRLDMQSAEATGLPCPSRPTIARLVNLPFPVSIHRSERLLISHHTHPFASLPSH